MATKIRVTACQVYFRNIRLSLVMPDKNLGFLLCIQALSSKSEMTLCGFAKKLLETVNPWRQNDGFMEKIMAYDT